MSQLNTKAAKLTEKYIKRSSDVGTAVNRKKRGLQAEINKVTAIRTIILSNDVDAKELLRFRASLFSLVSVVNSQLGENLVD